METLLCILLSPFVLVFALNYIKKYAPLNVGDVKRNGGSLKPGWLFSRV